MADTIVTSTEQSIVNPEAEIGIDVFKFIRVRNRAAANKWNDKKTTKQELEVEYVSFATEERSASRKPRPRIVNQSKRGKWFYWLTDE